MRIEARAYSYIHLVQVVHGGERPDIGKVVWDVKSRRCILQQGERKYGNGDLSVSR